MRIRKRLRGNQNWWATTYMNHRGEYRYQPAVRLPKGVQRLFKSYDVDTWASEETKSPGSPKLYRSRQRAYRMAHRRWESHQRWDYHRLT